MSPHEWAAVAVGAWLLAGLGAMWIAWGGEG